MKLKRNAHDVSRPELDDYYLLRWLKARKWNADAAEKMLRESMKWRESLNIDEIADWNPPYDLTDYYSYGFMGFTRANYPVAIVPLAGLDMMGFVKTFTRDELVKICAKIIEYHLNIAYEYSMDHGYNARQFIIVIDMEGLALRQYLTKNILELAIHLAKLYEANYPTLLKKVYVINAPSIFMVVFNILKKFLSAETISSVKIVNSDRKKWEKHLREMIDPDMLPKCYGGTLVDENGDEKCSQIICYGKKIPTNWYRNSQTSLEICTEDMQKIETEIKVAMLEA